MRSRPDFVRFTAQKYEAESRPWQDVRARLTIRTRKRARHFVPGSSYAIPPSNRVGYWFDFNGSMSGKGLSLVAALRLEVEEQGDIAGQHEGREHNHLP